MATVADRLYYDAGALEFRAAVTDIRLVSRAKPVVGAQAEAESPAAGQLWQVALDRTAFYPEGGGQPSDAGVLIATARSGAVLEVPVQRVEEDEAGEVWHYVGKPLVEGTEVVGRVDAERRMDHAQQHSGQHLLSAMFLRELGARTVSFHLGPHGSEELVTIDLAGPGLPGGIEKLSGDHLRRVEAAANRIVYEDRAVRSTWTARAEAQAMLERGDLRKLPEFQDYRAGGPVRIVEIEGVEFNACGGTHVGSTGAVGGVMVRRVERVKQGWRVEFCCGMRAVRLAGRDLARLGEAAAALTTGMAELPARVAALVEEAKATAKERRALVEDLARAEAKALVTGREPGAVVTATFAGKNLEFIKRVAAKIAEQGRAAVVCAETAQSSPAAASASASADAAGSAGSATSAISIARWAGSAVHCGNLLREVLAAAGGRGGGAAELAQGICPTEHLKRVMQQLAHALAG